MTIKIDLQSAGKSLSTVHITPTCGVITCNVIYLRQILLNPAYII